MAGKSLRIRFVERLTEVAIKIVLQRRPNTTEMSNQLTRHRVHVCYFDPFEVFPSIQLELEHRLPLQNLHWRSPKGPTRTIGSLLVNLVAETEDVKDDLLQDKPFIEFIVVSCTSIDEYRAKVRPLIRKRLPVHTSSNKVALPMKSIILLHSNAEILDSNLFKSISLVEKFTKDFPDVKTLEVKSVYKSETEKNYFWTNFMNRLKQDLLDVFQQRLNTLTARIDQINHENFEDVLVLHENMLKLYLSFNIFEEASTQLSDIREKILSYCAVELPLGELEIPFLFSQEANGEDRFGKLVKNQKLNSFKLHKYFFVKQFELLQISDFSAKKYSQLYRLIRQFFSSIEQAFHESPSLLQFKYFLIDEILKLQIFKDRSVEVAYEICAELKLMQRDTWLKLVYSCSNYRLTFKIFSKTIIKHDCSKLQDSFKDEETFHQSFLELTKTALALFKKCKNKRQRVTDILSVDVGVLHFQRQEYDKAISILQSCYEFYTESNWDIIGCRLLELFVNCLLKCPHLQSLSIDEEEIPVSTILSNSFLNLLASSKEAKVQWWDEFLKTNKDTSNNLVYPLDNLFEVNISPTLFLSDANVYALDLEVNSKSIPNSVAVNGITLLLKNNKDELVTFELADSVDPTIYSGKNKFLLETTCIIFGTFEFISLELIVGETVFSKEFDGFKSGEHIEFQPLYREDNFEVLVQKPGTVHLGMNTLDIEYSDVEDIEYFKMQLTVLKTETDTTPNISFTNDKKMHSVTITDFKEKSLEYFFVNTCDTFTLRQDLSFKKRSTSGITFEQTKDIVIDCRLPVSVSVEDFFKRDAFFFKFLINASSLDQPILLQHIDLISEEKNKYSIAGGFTPDNLLLKANDNESCLNFYQVQTFEGQRYNSKDIFHLEVTYNTLKEQLDELVTGSILLQGDVELSTNFEPWRAIWEDIVLPKLDYQHQLFEKKNVIKLAANKSYLEEIIEHLKAQVSAVDVLERVIKCLHSILTGVTMKPVDVDAYSKNMTPRRLRVPLTLPLLRQMFFVELKNELEKVPQVGEPIPMTICVTNLTDRWDTEAVHGDYSFEILNSNEWLVNGKRKTTVTSALLEFKIHLTPLKRGYLRYPKIEITQKAKKTFEVDYLNLYETILVV